MEKKFISIGSETLAYLDEGQGDVVLMVHGNMSSSVHYEPLITRIKGKYRCVAVDLRGFGDSTYNNRFDTLEELADDVNAFTILYKLATVLGFSFDKASLSEDEIQNALKHVCEVLNEDFKTINELLEFRNKAREEKNWDIADKIRVALSDVGIVVKDSKEGTILEAK